MTRKNKIYYYPYRIGSYTVLAYVTTFKKWWGKTRIVRTLHIGCCCFSYQTLMDLAYTDIYIKEIVLTGNTVITKDQINSLYNWLGKL